MKNYKYILEAVNRGIKFALDDFEDNEIQGQVNSKVKYQGGTKEYLEYLDLLEEVVDLGLPSGTLWCKYNLDVDPNQLTNPEDWYGKYYAWGETEPKLEYNWSTYKYAKGECNKLTKYGDNVKYNIRLDNLTELQPEDDAAYQFKKCHNYKFHIPTKEQIEELIKYTNNYQVNNYDPDKTIHNPKDDGGIQGLNGRVFIGKNKNQIFIPAAGYCSFSGIYDTCSSGRLWSSSLNVNDTIGTYYLYFNSDNITIYSNYRYFGYSIRPVINL